MEGARSEAGTAPDGSGADPVKAGPRSGSEGERPVHAGFVKVMTDFNERDYHYNPIDKSQFKGAASGILKIYHYVSYKNEGYGYDDAGNRTVKTISYIGASSEYSGSLYYPKTNRLLTDGTYAYQYDANGNMTAKGTMLVISGADTGVSDVTDWSGFTGSTAGSAGSISFAEAGEQWRYEYDLLNRLINVTKDGTLKASYTYNAEGLRIKKESGERTKYYSFDLSGNVLYEEDQDGAYRKYVYIKNTRFAREDGNTEGSAEVKRYYYHTDQLGSTVMVTDETGEVVWDAEYTPFGDINDPYKTEEGMIQFTGKDIDLDTGLYYFNARWYDPSLGRFMTEDPARDGLNWYAYCSNNPLRYVDPTGLKNVEGTTVDKDSYYDPETDSIRTGSGEELMSPDIDKTEDENNQYGNYNNLTDLLQNSGLINYPFDELGVSDLDVDSDIIFIIEKFIDDDFTGIVLAGDYLQVTALLTGAYEIGDVYEFKNGEIVNKIPYQSVSIGGEVDLGIEGGLSLTIFPGLTSADAFGGSYSGGSSGSLSNFHAGYNSEFIKKDGNEIAGQHYQIAFGKSKMPMPTITGIWSFTSGF